MAVPNSYCWMYSTMNIPPAFKGSCAKKEHDGATLYNSYYQFVSIFLVLQAGLFYAPRYMWLMLEGGLMKFLARGAREKIVEAPVEKRESLIRTFQVRAMCVLRDLNNHTHSFLGAYPQQVQCLCCRILCLLSSHLNCDHHAYISV